MLVYHTVTITTLPCIFRSERFVVPWKYHFNKYSTAIIGANLKRETVRGIVDRPSNMTLPNKGIGIVDTTQCRYSKMNAQDEYIPSSHDITSDSGEPPRSRPYDSIKSLQGFQVTIRSSHGSRLVAQSTSQEWIRCHIHGQQ